MLLQSNKSPAADFTTSLLSDSPAMLCSKAALQPGTMTKREKVLQDRKAENELRKFQFEKSNLTRMKKLDENQKQRYEVFQYNSAKYNEKLQSVRDRARDQEQQMLDENDKKRSEIENGTPTKSRLVSMSKAISQQDLRVQRPGTVSHWESRLEYDDHEDLHKDVSIELLVQKTE